MATIWVVWVEDHRPKPHGESWLGTLGQSSRHLQTITISAVSAQPSLLWSPAIDGEPEACGDARVEGAWYGLSYRVQCDLCMVLGDGGWETTEPVRTQPEAPPRHRCDQWHMTQLCSQAGYTLD